MGEGQVGEGRYEPQYYWWDFVFLLRRFFLCLCAVVFRGQPDVQAVRAPALIVGLYFET